MAYFIPCDGELEHVYPNDNQHFTLEELQSYVGGYIEIVHLSDSQCMVVNEEGKLQQLSFNSLATHTAHFWMAIAEDDYIVGNALICRSSEIQ